MRGQRKSVASALAQALARHRETGEAAIAAAFAEACGPRLAAAGSFRGVMRDGRLMVLVAQRDWATQFELHAAEICGRVNARLGRQAAAGLHVVVGEVGR
jgi:predicted nucleic acid-binding Zn ribbon protein